MAGGSFRTAHVASGPYRFPASRTTGTRMQVQSHPLEPFFHQAVRNSYEGRLGLGREIPAMFRACCASLPRRTISCGCAIRRGGRSRSLQRWCAPPTRSMDGAIVHRRALDQEVRRRLHAFHCRDVSRGHRVYPNNISQKPTLAELIRVGKESYYIVSQFNVFEYEKEAELYGQLSNSFEHCILGLAIARRDLWRTINPPAPVH